MGALEDLATELARLPGIGRKTASRLTYHLLDQPAGQVAKLASCLTALVERVRPCATCGYPTEGDACEYCQDPKRDEGIICVVEDAASVSVIERSAGYRGRYHILGGRLSPLDGVGPEQLRIAPLVERVAAGGVREVILATNPSMEGEVTATFVQQSLAGTGVTITRLARGLPMGGDLEYVDGATLAHALSTRQEVTR